MSGQADRAERFLALHSGEELLLLPNPWDPGSAKLLASLGFEALATTSGGSAATLGRPDGSMTVEEAIASATAIVEATELPVSADLENGFADDPEGVAETIRLALDAGLAGASIEDYSGREDALIYDIDLAAERVAAAAEIAHSSRKLVLTARAENHLHGATDLADTIARLQAYQEAGADVLYAPGLVHLEEIRQLVSSVDLPVNVLGRPGAPSVAELAAAGVRRVSVGGAFAYAALGATVEAARELLDEGTYNTSSGPASACRRLVRPLRDSRAKYWGYDYDVRAQPASRQPWIFSPRSNMPMNFRSLRARVSGFFASSSR
jgi:2-methylisocitrate lyase-like PEP mutase family enzyme